MRVALVCNTFSLVNKVEVPNFVNDPIKPQSTQTQPLHLYLAISSPRALLQLPSFTQLTLYLLRVTFECYQVFTVVHVVMDYTCVIH